MKLIHLCLIIVTNLSCVLSTDSKSAKQLLQLSTLPLAGNSLCDTTIRKSEGWFYSPNYPSNYPDNSLCVTTVERSSSDVCEVEITFEDFDIEDSRPACLNDYLEFGLGDRICGSLIDGFKHKIAFLPGQPSLRITFKSNGKKNRKGFMGKIRQIDNSCASFRTSSLEASSSNIHDTWGAHVGSCDQLITSYSGSIQSPGFPRPYTPNTVCAYTIKRASSDVCKIELNFRSLDIRGIDMNDCIDFIELPDRRKVCGMRQQQTIVLEFSKFSDYMVFMFRSASGAATAAGFDIDVRQIPGSCGSSDSLSVRKCDQTFTGYIRRLTSPNYPWSYMPNTFCMYMIEPTDSSMCYFSLEFNKFELDGVGGFVDGYCTRDLFQLPDGHRICSNTTGRRTYMFPSGGNRIAMFYFSSDSRAQGPGYDIAIRQHSCDDAMNSHENRLDVKHKTHMRNCDTMINRDQEVITSPYYPNDYSNNLRCRYTIVRQEVGTCYARLRFLNLDLEQSPDCTVDYLMIDSTGERLCRTDPNQEKIIRFDPSGQIGMTFVTDHQVSRSGFKILMDQLKGSCNRDINSGNYPNYPIVPQVPVLPFAPVEHTRICNTTSATFLIIASEHYPNHYRSNTDCIYRINRNNRNVCALEVFFQDFSVGTWDAGRCINDYLRIGEEYFCGYRKHQRVLHPFPASSRSIDLRFFTDSLINYPGFVLEIRQLETCEGLNFAAVSDVSFRSNGLPVAPYDWSLKRTPTFRSGGTLQPTSGGPFCGTQVFTEEMFDILSPGYEKGRYEKFTDCHYTIRKMHYTVCALEVKFKAFSLEDSSDKGCDKDFLQFGNNVKLCGKLPFETMSE